MLNQQQWDVAFAQLDALHRNIPSFVDEARVQEYHAIVHALQVASCDENIVTFRVPANEIRPKVVSVAPGGRRFRGHVNYSDKKYCDNNFFERQLDALWNYVQRYQHREQKVTTKKDIDYESLTDFDLAGLAVDRRLGVSAQKRKLVGSSEQYEYDRSRTIEALVRQDAERAVRSAIPTTHILNVHNMIGSSIQQGTDGSTAAVNFGTDRQELAKLLDKIKDCVDKIPITEDAKQELVADVRTAEAQMSSPKPKSTVIANCLSSAKNILEIAAGDLVASGLALEIGKLLQSLVTHRT
jgi:hypothetical protein